MFNYRWGTIGFLQIGAKDNGIFLVHKSRDLQLNYALCFRIIMMAVWRMKKIVSH